MSVPACGECGVGLGVDPHGHTGRLTAGPVPAGGDTCGPLLDPAGSKSQVAPAMIGQSSSDCMPWKSSTIGTPTDTKLDHLSCESRSPGDRKIVLPPEFGSLMLFVTCSACHSPFSSSTRSSVGPVLSW